MPQLFTAPLMRRYYAPTFSAAYLFRITTAVAAFLVPFLISYNIEPFWLTQSSYLVQPTVRFKHQMILMLEGTTPGSDLVWSTYDQLNAMLGSKFRVAEVQARETDENLDGRSDEVYLYARVPLKSGESIQHVRFIMFFDYQLQGKVNLQMESAAYFDHSAAVPGAECQMFGALEFRQRDVLPQASAVRTEYNTSIIVPSNGGIDSFNQVLFTTMVHDYLQRNETTMLSDVYPIWVAGEATDFKLTARVRIPLAQQVNYQPGVLETLRYGVIQFLAVYVFVAALIGATMHFIFENQVFESRVVDDSRPKMHVH